MCLPVREKLEDGMDPTGVYGWRGKLVMVELQGPGSPQGGSQNMQSGRLATVSDLGVTLTKVGKGRSM
jgi:hypothetical protein